MCKWCKFNELNDSVFIKDKALKVKGEIVLHTGLLLDPRNNTLSIDTFNPYMNKTLIDLKVKIKYCPNCGRKL